MSASEVPAALVFLATTDTYPRPDAGMSAPEPNFARDDVLMSAWSTESSAANPDGDADSATCAAPRWV